jgi:hypothetical protein
MITDIRSLLHTLVCQFFRRSYVEATDTAKPIFLTPRDEEIATLYPGAGESRSRAGGFSSGVLTETSIKADSSDA